MADKMLAIILLLSFITQVVNSAVTHAPATPKPTLEHSVYHSVWFHYNRYSLEHLLIAQEHNDCYCMPLTDKDVQDIQQKVGLDNLEHKLVSQIAQKMFIKWTHDDLAVRDGYWERRCKGNIFRVYRI